MPTRRTSRRRPSRRRRQTTTVSPRFVREALALVLVFLAIISVIALFAPNAGAIVRPWHDLLSNLLGWGIAFAPPLLAGFAVMLWMKTMPAERWMAATGAALVAIGLLGMFHLGIGGGTEAIERGDGGGIIGYGVSAAVSGAIGAAGAWVVLVLIVVVGLLLYFNMTIGDIVAAWLQERDERRELAQDEARRATAGTRGGRVAAASAEPSSEPRTGIIDRMRGALAGGNDAHEDEPPLIVRRQRPETTNVRPDQRVARPVLPPAAAAIPVGNLDAGEDPAAELDAEERAHLARAEPVAAVDADAALDETERIWDLPSLDVLADAPPSTAAQMDLHAKGQRIRDTLRHFGIGVKIARIQEGPVVTQYALEVEPGIKLSRIEGLADNLALALAARSIRIQAPIPGEGFVGIEIPNNAFDLVTLKEVLASHNFDDLAAKSSLAFALGQDVAGQPFSADLARCRTS